MKKIFLSLLINLLIYNVYAQTAPAHLKYFGFAGVDALMDDPHDSLSITNYINEVDSFSNIAHMRVYAPFDTIISRVNLMTSKCVKAIVQIQDIFYDSYTDTTMPNGVNFYLYSNFQSRWNIFKSINAAVLDSSQIVSFYVCDEPVWNGVGFGELDSVCALVKNDFPDIPVSIVEAYPIINNLQVPTAVDLLGFDRYGVFDPSTDLTYLNELNILKSKRSTPNQKIILIADDQWFPGFWPASYQPDTIQYVVQNYYTLAASDTDIVGIVGFIWPGGVPDLGPTHLGLRDLPQSVIAKNVQIGKMIKANYSPCNTVGIENNDHVKSHFTIYPNPVQERLNIVSLQNNETAFIKIYNAMGKGVKGVVMTGSLTAVTLSDLSTGLYFYLITDRSGNILDAGKFVKE